MLRSDAPLRGSVTQAIEGSHVFDQAAADRPADFQEECKKVVRMAQSMFAVLAVEYEARHQRVSWTASDLSGNHGPRIRERDDMGNLSVIVTPLTWMAVGTLEATEVPVVVVAATSPENVAPSRRRPGRIYNGVLLGQRWSLSWHSDFEPATVVDEQLKKQIRAASPRPSRNGRW